MVADAAYKNQYPPTHNFRPRARVREAEQPGRGRWGRSAWVGVGEDYSPGQIVRRQII